MKFLINTVFKFIVDHHVLLLKCEIIVVATMRPGSTSELRYVTGLPPIRHGDNQLINNAGKHLKNVTC